MKKEYYLELCTTKPEEVFKLFCVMGETINTLQNQVVALNGRVEKLQAEVKELKSRLDKNSRNSNKPPSTDAFNPKAQCEKSGKKTGGQKGHQGHTLKMSDNPDRIVTHHQEHCTCCAHELDLQLPGNTERRQIFDIPLSKPEITEHQRVSVSCPSCGLLNKGVFPEEVTQPIHYGKGIIA